jgi:hypothetical protein
MVVPEFEIPTPLVRVQPDIADARPLSSRRVVRFSTPVAGDQYMALPGVIV